MRREILLLASTKGARKHGHSPSSHVSTKAKAKDQKVPLFE
jgi:hypothetical protein